MVDITLLKFSSSEAAQTAYLLSPLTGPALLIYHDQLPTLIAIIHSPVHKKAHRAAALSDIRSQEREGREMSLATR